MKRFKATLAICILSLLITLLPFVPQVWSQQRGQGVRIKNNRGEIVDLYAESHALVIGVSKYTAGWNQLEGVKGDVRNVEGVLRFHGFDVKTLLDPTSIELKQAIVEFIDSFAQKKDNRVFVYFAGHGYTDPSPNEVSTDHKSRPRLLLPEIGYIVPADAPRPDKDPEKFHNLAISTNDIFHYAKRIQSKHSLFIFDSCFSGALFRIDRGSPELIKMKTEWTVRQFITAGTASQTVSDNSVFCQELITGLYGAADLTHDGYITGRELGVFLEDRVARFTRNYQTPQWGAISSRENGNFGDFVFALPKVEQQQHETPPRPAQPTPPQPPQPMPPQPPNPPSIEYLDHGSFIWKGTLEQRTVLVLRDTTVNYGELIGQWH